MGKALPHKKQKNNLPRVDKHIDILILGQREDNYRDFIEKSFSSLKVVTISDLFRSMFWENNIIENMSKVIEYVKNSEVIIYDNEDYNFMSRPEISMLFGFVLDLNKIAYPITGNVSDDRIAYNNILEYLKRNIIIQTEIERKWIISEDLYNTLTRGERKLKWDHIYDIIQFYDHHGVRYRQQKIRNTDDAIWNKNLKSKILGETVAKNEIECNIQLKEWISKYREFKRLAFYQRPIKKIRHCRSTYGLEFELNKIKISTQSIHMIEIEYNIIELMMNFGLREYLINAGFDSDFIDANIYEVTNNPDINNKTFMRLNTDRIKGGKEYESFCLYRRKINELCPNSMTKNPKGIKIFNEK